MNNVGKVWWSPNDFFLWGFVKDQVYRTPVAYSSGSSTFWARGPISIFNIILRAVVIADYKIIMDILNIIIGALAARQVTCLRLILQPLHRIIYVTAHSPTLPPLYLRHSSFYSPSIASPTSQLILQSFRCFTYVVGTSPTSQLIPQPFRRFTYVAAHSTALPLLHLCHRDFTYVTWRAAHRLWWCLIYPWWFCNLQWLRPAGLYERCKLALELKRLKTTVLNRCTCLILIRFLNTVFQNDGRDM